MTTPGSATAPITVLYLAGSGRSGTTVITTILGQLPGVVAAGELRYLWQRGVVENQWCGCGEHFDSCPFWSAVMARAGNTDAPAIAGGLRRRLRLLRVPAMAVNRALRRPPVPPHPDDERIVAAYRALAEQTGARVIVDSSKLPPYGLLLEERPEIDLRVLHVVRDPRATAFSWRRPKDDPAAGAPMPRMDVAKSTGLWLIWNLLTARWWPARVGKAVRFRYEDFVADPRGHLDEVARLIGADPADLPFVAPDEVTLAVTHSVAGNPNRHTTGTVRIRGDIEWQHAMPTKDRRVVSMLALPGLWRFGYPRSGAATGTPARQG